MVNLTEVILTWVPDFPALIRGRLEIHLAEAGYREAGATYLPCWLPTTYLIN